MHERSIIGSFEGARGLAALLVAVYHFEHLVPYDVTYPVVVRYGYLFVDLFFVLSGCVICAAYEARLETGNDLWTFAIRRFGRLFPLLVASTVAFVLVPNLQAIAKHALFLLGHANLFRDVHPLPYTAPSLAEVVATLTMTHGLGLFDKTILNFVSWSISTEFYTYLLFAVACFLVSGRLRIVLFVVLSASAFVVTCWSSLVLHDCVTKQSCMDITYDFGLLRCITSFFLGCLTYHATRHLGEHGNSLQTCALLAIGAVFAMIERVPQAAFACPVVFALLIFALSSDRGYLARLLNMAPAQVLGQRSYSIYLMHPVLIEIFGLASHKLGGRALAIPMLTVYLVMLVMVSGLTYRYVEAPFRDLFNRWARQQQLAPAATAST